jgi:hypothetical protein
MAEDANNLYARWEAYPACTPIKLQGEQQLR